MRQDVIAGSPKSGVNTITGHGLKEAMAGTQLVIDLANSPSFEDRAVLEFFETSGRNLLGAEAAAAVQHHMALSTSEPTAHAIMAISRQVAQETTDQGIACDQQV